MFHLFFHGGCPCSPHPSMGVISSQRRTFPASAEVVFSCCCVIAAGCRGLNCAQHAPGATRDHMIIPALCLALSLLAAFTLVKTHHGLDTPRPHYPGTLEGRAPRIKAITRLAQHPWNGILYPNDLQTYPRLTSRTKARTKMIICAADLDASSPQTSVDYLATRLRATLASQSFGRIADATTI